MTDKQIKNGLELVMSAVDTLKAAGWNDEQIIPHLRGFADEAIKFLANKWG